MSKGHIRQMSIVTEHRVKISDLVEIVKNVHDERMPSSKVGVIVDVVGKEKDQVLVMFSNHNTLKFHVTQISQIISSA